MHHFTQILALAAAASLAAAADTKQPMVTSLLLPFNDPSDFVATVLGVDGSATTFAYTCASSVSPDDCGMNTHGTIVQGPSTWQMSLSQSDEEGVFAITAACALTSSKDEASCSFSESQSNSDGQGSSTKTGVSTGYISELQAVTVVAGLDKLTGGAVPTATTAPSTASSASSSSAKSTSGASQSAASSSAASSGAASSSSGAASSSSAASSGSKTSSTNAAPAATQQALLAGVAAVVGALVF